MTKVAVFFAHFHDFVEFISLALGAPVIGPDQVEFTAFFEEAKPVYILQHTIHAHVFAVFPLTEKL
jgi:hypothetical protein